MPADSTPRRLLKRILSPVLSPSSYRWVQSAARAWDIRTGQWTEPEMEIIPYAVRNGETVIDIGAAYGLYCYPLSRAVGPSGRVFAFEPIPENQAIFQNVARLLALHNVELIPKGCAEKTGQITFRLPTDDHGVVLARLIHIAERDNTRTGSEEHIPFHRSRELVCDVVAIDDHLSHISDVSFIKCDIEGAELFAFRGARKLFDKERPTVVCEINPWFLQGFNLRVQDLVGFFSERGYRVYRYQDHRLHPTAVEAIVSDNWVFVHPNRLDRLAPLLR